MAMYLSSILVLSLLIILPDLWFYLKMKKHRFYRWLRFSALVPGILFIMSFFYIRYGLRYNDNYLLTSRISWIFVILALIYTPKIIYIIFYYLNRLFNRVFGKRTRILRVVGFGSGQFSLKSIALYALIGAVVAQVDWLILAKRYQQHNTPPNKSELQK